MHEYIVYVSEHTQERFYEKEGQGALAGAAPLAEWWTLHQSVTVSIPDRGTCPGCGLNPWSGCLQEAANPCFSLTLMFLSFSHSLKNQ